MLWKGVSPSYSDKRQEPTVDQMGRNDQEAEAELEEAALEVRWPQRSMPERNGCIVPLILPGGRREGGFWVFLFVFFFFRLLSLSSFQVTSPGPEKGQMGDCAGDPAGTPRILKLDQKSKVKSQCPIDGAR